jgi:hypothetical protein
MESVEIIAGGQPCGVFDHWVDTLNSARIQATQISIAEYDREREHNPSPHPRGNEVYVLVPAERLEEALKILNASERSSPSMRRPVSVKSLFHFFSLLFISFFSKLFPLSQAASVATLPSALFVERFSLGASWVFSFQ